MELYSILSGFLPDILLFTQAPILVRFDGTNIDISIILLTMHYRVFMFCYDRWLCMVINISVQYNGGFLPDIILLTQAPILVWFDGTIIDISTTLLTMHYSVYVLL